ncbi:MAG TPA: hypothetical protein VFN61_10670 [Acidimicrobiales bacterium]|nr:hypothetical protein [Acidimicrobiales bacterium]
MSEVVTDDRRERYLALRSSFLDRFVANATEAGVGQFVVVGGGYSGGSTFGPTRWWQVPSGPAMDKALVEDGFQVESPTRFILAKGAKLAEEELFHLLRSARSLASPGTRLAIC